MKLYVGVNSDGTAIISKMPLKRYIDYETNKDDVLCFKDTQLPPHWIMDYTGINIPKLGDIPIDKYLTVPAGAIQKMFGFIMTWDTEAIEVEV